MPAGSARGAGGASARGGGSSSRPGAGAASARTAGSKPATEGSGPTSKPSSGAAAKASSGPASAKAKPGLSKPGAIVAKKPGAGSPRPSQTSENSDEIKKHKKEKPKAKSIFRFPKCKCCMFLCPCMYCCHPDSTIDRETVIRLMQGTGKNKKTVVNMALVEDQLRQDRERLQDHKRKWRRRWLVFCCCSFWMILSGATATVVVLATNSWSLVTEDCGWEGRIHFGAVFTPEKRMVIAGGTNLEKNMADVWASEDGGYKWNRMIDIANFGPRHGHVLLHYPNPSHLLVIGGDGGSILGSTAIPLKDVWKSTDGRDWVLVTNKAPWPARKLFGATVDAAGVIYILGGMGVFGITGLNDMWKSEDKGLTWSPISLASPWSARYSFSLVRLPGGTRDGRFLILGGTDGRAQHDVWASDDNGQKWNLMDFLHVSEYTYKNIKDVASWSPRYGMGVAADNDGMITVCAGGTDKEDAGAFSNQVWQIDSPPPESVPWYLQKTRDPRLNRPKYPEKWNLKGTPTWSPRRYLQSFVDHEGTVHIVGGEDIEGLKNDLWKMETSIDLKNLQEAYERTRSQAKAKAYERAGRLRDGDKDGEEEEDEEET
mmetsp:Transcript_60328/g.113881  ORF Transcript_60328/g.113881 Transcript_60328/m.113881 type:complete len:599 (+) Transcript_60328:94-1890(+)